MKMKIKVLHPEEKAKWDAFVSVAVRLVTRNRWTTYRQHQRRFVRFVDHLLQRYGDAPRLLATRADMMQRGLAKLPYLERAYRGAVARRDRQEMVLTAHSIAQIHLERRQTDLATVWVKRLRKNLAHHRDQIWSRDCSDMEKRLKEMRTRKSRLPRVPLGT